MITIEKHKLKDTEGKLKVSYQESPNVSGPFKAGFPDTIVIHYTAGGSASSSAKWLQNPKAKASAHLVIGKKGEIFQLAPFDIRTWHAGRSSWKGRSGLNQYSIGIEIDNAGILTQTAEGYMTHFSKLVPNKSVVLAKHKLDAGERGWEAYTPQQIDMVEAICLALVETYNISEIVGHDDIAPSRKRDPGPAFPMDSLRNKVLFGRDEDLPDEPDDSMEELAIVSADNLNIRATPGTDSSLVSNPLKRGTKVKITKTQGGWSYVKTDIEGWVSNQWLRTV
jgi:N-acetylmuramoyl-L-alanine amidase